MAEIIEERRPESQTYFKERDGICRLIEAICLTLVEGCLGVGLSAEPKKGYVHLIIAIIPLATIICLIVAHVHFGPYEAWPTLRNMSWKKLESLHDLIVFLLMLPSAVVLIIPPCTKFEISAGVLTLVVPFLVALQGIEKFCRMQNKQNHPVSATYTNNESTFLANRLQQPNLVSSPNNLSHRCSTPLYTNAGSQAVKTVQVLSKTNSGNFKRKVQFMNSIFSLKASPINCDGLDGINKENLISPNFLHPRVEMVQEFHSVSYHKYNPRHPNSAHVHLLRDDSRYLSSISLPEINLSHNPMNNAFIGTSSNKVYYFSYDDRDVKVSNSLPRKVVKYREKIQSGEMDASCVQLSKTSFVLPTDTVERAAENKNYCEIDITPIDMSKSSVTHNSPYSVSDTLLYNHSEGPFSVYPEMCNIISDTSCSPMERLENISAYTVI